MSEMNAKPSALKKLMSNKLFTITAILVAMILISVFNVMKESDKMHRFLPLTLSAIVQGAMTALFLTSITQPAG